MILLFVAKPDDANQIKKAFEKRLVKFKLRINEKKTKMVNFSKTGDKRGIKKGAFDFLGFTYYLGRSAKGYVIPKVKTNGKSFRTKLKNVNIWCRKIRNLIKLKEIWKIFCSKIRGHINYYGVTYNLSCVERFCHKSIWILFKLVNKRSQRKSFSWKKFEKFLKLYPPPKIMIKHALY